MASVSTTLNYEHGQMTLIVMTIIILLLVFLDNRGVLAGVIKIATGKDTLSGGGTSFGAKSGGNSVTSSVNGSGTVSGGITIPPISSQGNGALPGFPTNLPGATSGPLTGLPNF